MKLRYFYLAAALTLAACNTKPAPPQFIDQGTIYLDDKDSTTVSLLQDEKGDKMMPRDLFPDASDSLMAALNLQDGVPSSICVYLMHTQGNWIMFDTGLGADKGGMMLNSLRLRGLTPDSINYIYLTHFHGDHIGGMLQDGKAVFPNAKVYANQREYMAWMMEMPSEKTEWQRNVMDAYRNQTTLFAYGDTLPFGVIAVAAPGHTPGHTVFQKENLLIAGDLMHGAALQLEHPEISGNYDMDKEEAAQSRINILNMVKENDLMLIGMHLPVFSVIHLEKDSIAQ